MLACIETCCTALVAAMCCCFLVKQVERRVLLLLGDYMSAAPWYMTGSCRCLLTLCWCAGSALWKCFCIPRIAAQICWSGVQDWQSTMQGPQTQNDMFPALPTPICGALVVQHVCLRFCFWLLSILKPCIAGKYPVFEGEILRAALHLVMVAEILIANVCSRLSVPVFTFHKYVSGRKFSAKLCLSISSTTY